MLLKYGNKLEQVTSDLCYNFSKPLTNLNLYSNSFGWQIFPIYFHLKLHKNANNTNSGSFAKKLDSKGDIHQVMGWSASSLNSFFFLEILEIRAASSRWKVFCLTGIVPDQAKKP